MSRKIAMLILSAALTMGIGTAAYADAHAKNEGGDKMEKATMSDKDKMADKEKMEDKDEMAEKDGMKKDEMKK